jgi:hypothetical protein
MLSEFEAIQETRPGEMLIEDLVAINECGHDTGRIGVAENGDAVVYVANEHIADKLEPALQNAQHIRTRVVPKVTRERLELALPAADDDDQ